LVMRDILNAFNIQTDITNRKEHQKGDKRNNESFQILNAQNEHLNKEAELIINSNVLKQSCKRQQ